MQGLTEGGDGLPDRLHGQVGRPHGDRSALEAFSQRRGSLDSGGPSPSLRGRWNGLRDGLRPDGVEALGNSRRPSERNRREKRKGATQSVHSASDPNQVIPQPWLRSHPTRVQQSGGGIGRQRSIPRVGFLSRGQLAIRSRKRDRQSRIAAGKRPQGLQVGVRAIERRPIAAPPSSWARPIIRQRVHIPHVKIPHGGGSARRAAAKRVQHTFDLLPTQARGPKPHRDASV